MGFGLIFWLVILAVIVMAVMWFVRSVPHANRLPPTEGRSPGLDVLEERYARGEISREDYLQKKRDITG
ncbi:MAG: SHOCT domain-containing protein [Methyloceanibacter sp.]